MSPKAKFNALKLELAVVPPARPTFELAVEHRGGLREVRADGLPASGRDTGAGGGGACEACD
jgi:hypothetical protein